MWTRRKVLGLAFASRSLTAVEIAAGNGTATVTGARTFVYPDGLGPDKPAALGAALKEFLQNEGFAARGLRCVIGMEAKWLTSRPKSLPPGPEGTIGGVLRLAVEREFASNSGELVTDYACGPPDEAARQVVLFAAGRQYVDQLTQTVQAARLRAVSVTSSTAALAAAAGGADGSRRFVLNLLGDGAELAILPAGSPPVVRRLSAALPAESTGEQRRECLDGLVAELRRTLRMPTTDDGPQAAAELVIPTGDGLDEADARHLAERLSLSLRTFELPENLDAGGTPEVRGTSRYAAAASLALMGLEGAKPVFDFLHSRMKVAPRRALGKRAVYAGGAVALLLVGLVALLVGWQHHVRAAEELDARLRELDPRVTEAERIVQNISLARQWYLRRPRFLDCMRELTLAFPEEGRIWATSVGIEENKEADDVRLGLSVSGKAVSKTAVLDVMDLLKANPRFAEIKILYLRESNRSQREVAFAMSCTLAEGS